MLLATAALSATAARAQATEDACEGWLAAFLFREFREPFWKAATAETVQVCLDAGVDVAARVNDGETALWHAAEFAGNAEVLEVLISAGADPNTQAGVNGEAPLHLVDDAASVRALVAAGADPNARDLWGFTPIHVAGNWETAQALIIAGADPTARGGAGHRPLHLAAERRDPEDPESVKGLIAAGGDPNARDDNGYTPLHSAA